MDLIYKFIENRPFEEKIRSIYSKKVCDIAMSWIENSLGYILIQTTTDGIFNLGLVDTDVTGIKSTNEYFSFNEIILLIMKEMKESIGNLDLDDKETRDFIEKQYDILDNAFAFKIS